MKNINEAAKESTMSLLDVIDELTLTETEERIEDVFRKGVEFAQRWIPLQEELPESSDKILLVKWTSKNGIEKYGLATYFDMSIFCKKDYPSRNFTIMGSCLRKVTHWRPIELK